MNRFEIVERLESVLEKVWKKIDRQDIHYKGEVVDTFGVMFLGGAGYLVNNHVVGRISISEDMSGKDVAWNSDTEEVASVDDMMMLSFQGEEKEAPREWLERYYRQVKKQFHEWKNYIYKVNRKELIDQIDELFGRRHAAKKDYRAVFLPDREKIILTDGKGANIELEVPFFGQGENNFSASIVDGDLKCGFVVNLYYLYYILQAFREYTIVSFAFNDNVWSQVMIKAQNPAAGKPRISFAIAQVIVDNYRLKVGEETLVISNSTPKIVN